MRRNLRAIEPALPNEDADALDRIARGDLSGLADLYDRHAQELWRFARRVAPHEDADDVVQTVFVRVIRIASGYDARVSSARAWLFGVAAFVLKERRRSFQRFMNALREHTVFAREQVTPSPAASVDVSRALSRLTEAKRIVLLLAEVEGFTCPEIANILHVPVGTVWTRLHYARAALLAHFEEPP